MKSYTEGMVQVTLSGTPKTQELIDNGTIVVTEPGRGLMGETNPERHSLTSRDPKEIVAFLAKDFSTAGMRFAYVVNHDTREVVEIVKTGNKFAQRDVKPLLAAGFTEFVTPNMAPKNYRLPDGEIIQVSRSIDCSPSKTLRNAMSYAGIL